MKRLVVGIFIALSVGCSSKLLQYDKIDELKKVDEYDKNIAVKELPATENPQEVAKQEAPAVTPEPAPKKKKKKAKKEKQKKVESTVHLPDIEDSEGFVGRRPVVDPFRIGEKTVLNISYFNIVAGTLSVEVKPFVEVNGEKAYHFEAHAQSNSLFNHIYAINDRASTYVSYKDLIPFNLEITLTEAKQLAETRTLFDWENLKAHYWKKRVTQEHGEEQNKIDWEIKAFSQNVISAAYYLRTFTMRVGKSMAIRVVDEGKNIVFTGTVIRREELQTDAGTFQTVVIRPKLEVDGVFAPVGEILIWLTDDDRKFIVRAETKIKIGSIVGKVKEIFPGAEPTSDAKSPASAAKTPSAK
jgi:Protein of unknown function (DUF3108)